MKYKIIRFYQDPDRESQVVMTGLTREEAQAHCHDPETSSSTATGSVARHRTEKLGPWFDGWMEE